MPYIVTTKRDHPVTGVRTASRHAVATLEEARSTVEQAVTDGLAHSGLREAHYIDARTLPESGGTVGPLPDGTVIEVEPTTYDDLLATGLDCPPHIHPHGWGMAPSHIRRPGILDAYNARQS